MDLSSQRYGKRRSLAVALSLFGATIAATAQTATVVEYYHRGLDAYFITARANEQAALDTLTNDFTRTGAQFTATSASAPSFGQTRICRFYISLASPSVSSHFYGNETECDTLRAAAPAGFSYEGFEFATALPINQSCPQNAPVPIYRSFRFAQHGRTPNHRYSTSRAVYDAMNASGWTPEGIAFCATSATPANSANVASFKTVISPTTTPFAIGCDGFTANTGTLNRGSEVEPYIARNPNNENHLLASWQQDRWSDGGAAGLGGTVSFDGGRTWSNHYLPFSRCAGGNASSGGDYARATDPWSAIAADGTAYQMALAFTDETPTVTGVSAMLVSLSSDGGRNWEPPATLIRDVSNDIFNDKNMMVAHPTNANLAFAVWGRIDLRNGSGPARFSRTTDRGATWEASRDIYDPGFGNQTFGNQLIATPSGLVANVFLEILRTNGRTTSSRFKILRSTDSGVTWSAPIDIAESLAVGTRDPETDLGVRDGAGLASVAVGADGSLHMVWQDARFSGGAIDAIAYARSSDGGLT
jgi:Repeat of unknown function (DUF5648)